MLRFQGISFLLLLSPARRPHIWITFHEIGVSDSYIPQRPKCTNKRRRVWRPLFDAPPVVNAVIPNPAPIHYGGYSPHYYSRTFTRLAAVVPKIVQLSHAIVVAQKLTPFVNNLSVRPSPAMPISVSILDYRNHIRRLPERIVASDLRPRGVSNG